MAYPHAPGWKRRATSLEAAQSVAPVAPTLRARVLQAVTDQPGTPEEIAARLNVPLMNVRPRLSELAALNLIEDSGERGEAMGGKRAIRWRAA